MYLDSDSSAVFAPTNFVFGTIIVLEDTKFESSGGLVSELSNKFLSTEDLGHSNIGASLDDSVVFPKGTVLHGRWTSISLEAGKIVVYFSN